MKTIVNSLVLYSIILCGCSTSDCISGVYLSKSKNQLLLIDTNNWKILHSGVATFCDRFEVIRTNQNDKKLIVLDSIRSKNYKRDTMEYFHDKDMIIIEDIIFRKLEKIEWDSIVVTSFRNNSLIEYHMIESKKSDNLELELFASTILIQDFNYLDTILVESNQYLLLELFLNNKCIAAKVGANKFTCIDY